MHHPRSSLFPAILLLAAASALASQPDAAKPAIAEPTDALSGPKVTTPTEKPTLVKRDFGGALTKLDIRPEAAAIELIGLTKEERAAADAVLTKRAETVHKALTENLAAFLEIQAARQGGGKMEEIRPKIRALRESAPDLFEPTLSDQLAKTMTEPKAAEMRTLVAEYVTALAAEGAKEQRGDMATADRRAPQPPPVQPGAMPRQVENNLVLREMGRSLGALVAERKQRTEQLLKAVNATPEQEAQIQTIVRGNEKQGQGRKLEPTAEQRAEIARKIMAILTPEQRKAWLAVQRGEK